MKKLLKIICNYALYKHRQKLLQQRKTLETVEAVNKIDKMISLIDEIIS